MTDFLTAGRQDRTATVLGWLVFISFIALLFNIIILPRTALDQRAPLQMMHDTLGFLLFVLVLARLYWWFRGPPPQPPKGLPAASFNFNRAILFALLLTFLAEAIIGPFYAWSERGNVGFFGAYLPVLMERSEGVRVPMGYLHSTLGFYYLMLITIWLFFGVYQHFRYRVGLRRLFPGAAV